MGAASTSELTEKVGLTINDFKDSELAIVDSVDVAHFIPPNFIAAQYRSFLEKEKYIDITKYIQFAQSIIKQYTEHKTQLCTRLNLSLVSDNLKLTGLIEYCSQLKQCIKQLAKLNPIDITQYKECYRGFFCSPIEFSFYIPGNNIYIPSFLSTSLDSAKSYQRTKEKSNINTLLIIKFNESPDSALEITKEFSDYATDEKELLFACYSKFKVLSAEEVKNTNLGIQYKLVLEYIQESEQFANTIRNNYSIDTICCSRQEPLEFKKLLLSVMQSNWTKLQPYQQLGIFLPFSKEINYYLSQSDYKNLESFKQHIVCAKSLIKNSQWHNLAPLKGSTISFSGRTESINQLPKKGEIFFNRLFLIGKHKFINQEDNLKIKIKFPYEPKAAIKISENMYYNNCNYKDFLIIDSFSKFKVLKIGLGKKWYDYFIQLEYINQPQQVNSQQLLFFARMLNL